MMDYVRRPDYDSDDAPGICAGISHNQVGDKHVFRLHFNDQQSQDQINIPSQMNPVADRFVRLVKQEAFVLYGREGYNYFQNWMANQMLRRYTNVPNAMIISMVAPMKSETIVID